VRTPSSGLVAGQIMAEGLARFTDAYAEVWNSADLERIVGGASSVTWSTPWPRRPQRSRTSMWMVWLTVTGWPVWSCSSQEVSTVPWPQSV
jgi:hypothetical protein